MGWSGRLAACLAAAVLGLASGAPGEEPGPDLGEVRRAADRGDTAAQMVLALSFDLGEGAAQDSAEAARWYERAADQGIPEAHLYLGAAYLEGRGVRMSPVAAYLLLDLAAAQLGGRNRELAEDLRQLATARMNSLEMVAIRCAAGSSDAASRRGRD